MPAIARTDADYSQPRKGFLLTDDEWHELHVALDKTRSTSATVKVPRQALTNLLIDHSRLHRKEQG